jgi:hypothetical protein
VFSVKPSPTVFAIASSNAILKYGLVNFDFIKRQLSIFNVFKDEKQI